MKKELECLDTERIPLGELWNVTYKEKYTLFLDDIFRKEEMIIPRYYITPKELAEIFHRAFGDCCIY